MASPSKIVIPARPTITGIGLAGAGQLPQSAAMVSDLLQKNHDTHHIFFNDDQFHNHQVHHLLALYALGASAERIKSGYEYNDSYQRPLAKADEQTVKELFDEKAFLAHLGKEKHYSDYLRFFQKEMEKSDWKEVVGKYIFSDTDMAKDMTVRLYSGFLHPFIHLGYGIEHEQPAIIAEALAQTAIHENWPKGFLEGCEEKFDKNNNTKSLVELLDECKTTKELEGAAQFSDGQKNKGVMKRAGDTMIRIASQWGAYDEDQLDAKIAEVINLCGYMTGAAQRPDKEIKMDFFLMHCINSSIFLNVFATQDWIPTAHKLKLTTWLGRLSVNMYVSRGNPTLNIKEIAEYIPKEDAASNPWVGVITRGINFNDDGHCVKFVRACLNGERVCRGREGEKGIVMTGDMWIKLANMVVDSAERKPGDTWARSVGFDEAWKGFKAREVYKGKL